MLILHKSRTYTARLERNGPGPTWTRHRLSAAQVQALVRDLSRPPFAVRLRNDSLVITDDCGNSQYLYF